MKTRKQLLQSKEYWISKIQIDLYNALKAYMHQQNINATQLATKLNVSKGYISQILNGNFDHKLSKLVELSLAIDKVPIIRFMDFNSLEIQKDPIKSKIKKQAVIPSIKLGDGRSGTTKKNARIIKQKQSSN
jgi:transcriptional regulator with XRE-family HTH domain